MDTDLTRIGLKALSFPYSLRQICTSDAFKDSFQRPAPNVIISDSSIPGMDTGVALAFVQENHSHIPFIFFSGNLSPTVHDLAMIAGAAAFIDKNDPSLLISTLERIQKRVAGKLPEKGHSVMVQCEGFRCMGYISRNETWLDSFRHLPLPEVFTWEDPAK